MKSRPILFSAPMVRALLDGSKTQTRRVAKLTDAAHVKEPRGHRRWHPADPEARLACPYGQPGENIIVRETWQYANWTEDGYPFIRYRADNTSRLCDRIPDDGWSSRLMDIWAALSIEEHFGIDQSASDRKWRPAIHMPKWASRITLEITGVRLERLHDISETDAVAEGVYTDPACPAYEGYQALWESINGPESWAANPWVWVIEFKRATS